MSYYYPGVAPITTTTTTTKYKIDTCKKSYHTGKTAVQNLMYTNIIEQSSKGRIKLFA